MGSVTIPVMRPKLAECRAISVYLKRIDESRYYSNRGPLVHAFEERLADHLGVTPDCVTTVSSATAGLVLALMAVTGERGGSCVLPSWTFEAGPASVRCSGLAPHFADIDAATWSLSRDDVLGVLDRAGDNVRAMMFVPPFGAPADVAGWQDLSRSAGVPLVIDAAGGFDSVRIVEAPTVISLHATKVLGCGEGGMVVSSDGELISHLRHLSNFGFSGNRTIRSAGLNAKMSEYAAAVGLAELDLWQAKRARFMAVKMRYIERLAEHPLIKLPPGSEADWVTSTFNVKLPGATAAGLMAHLRDDGIESRVWWARGCHRQPAFRDCEKTRLRTTELFADSVVGLPFYTDLPARDIDSVCDSMFRFLEDHLDQSRHSAGALT